MANSIDWCESMSTPKEQMEVLAAGGLGGVCISRGGSICELTNWDSTKKKDRWGIG